MPWPVWNARNGHMTFPHSPWGTETRSRGSDRHRPSCLRQCRAVIHSLLYLLLRRVLGLFRSDDRAAAEVELENVVLRHQIAVLRRQVMRPLGVQNSDS